MPRPMNKLVSPARCLLPISLALLMCACDTPGFVEDSTEEASLTLDTAQPHAVRRLRLRGETRKGARAKFSRVELNVYSTVDWVPDEGARTDVLPWYRIRLVDDRDGRVHSEDVVRVQPNIHYGSLNVSADEALEASATTVDTSFRLELDRQGAPSEGTFDVTWKANATLLMDDGAPEDIQFIVTEEPG